MAQGVNLKVNVNSKLNKGAKLNRLEPVPEDSGRTNEEHNGVTNVKRLPSLQYPFREVTDEILQFPRRQLYFQNSTIAILVANPNRHVEVELSKVERPRITTKAEFHSSYKDYQPDKTSEFRPLKTTTKPSKSAKSSVEKKKPSKIRKSKPTRSKRNESDIELSVSVKHSCKDHPNGPVKLEFVKNTQDKRLQSTELRLVDLNYSRNYLLLDVDQVCSILSNNDLNVSNETMVFRFAMRWLNFDIENRRIQAERVLECVRFGLIKPRASVRCHTKCLEMGFLESPSLCTHLYCGILWSCAKCFGLEHLLPHMEPEPRNFKNKMKSETPLLTSYNSSFISVIVSD